ncbi:hypothetical protein AVEN_161253-1 [Araneus ventricosus]|uniref:Laminin G domain-containing protein n=2 Tax=Araneus ventricosus TaxID=182803 RepID=A0A4Y1ZJR4_ARAVE|nr:hypothetical protein AVEN_147365-1 [Araneus ventricosus]GBL53266.1 hypothetical protein AVEN_161253-1 [Araneus ventricosus]
MYDEDDLNLQLSQKLADDSTCDYKWHDIRMNFVKNYLALHVDSLKPVEEKIKNIPANLSFAEIYIGGKPEEYLHKGEDADYFSGCLKGMTLNGFGLNIHSEPEDVVRHECPQL